MSRKRLKLGLLAAMVTALHAWFTTSVATDRMAWGSAAHKLPARMQVAFVRELQQQRSPVVAPSVRPAVAKAKPKPAHAAQIVAAAASAPMAQAESAQAAEAVPASVSEPTPEAQPPMQPAAPATAPAAPVVAAEPAVGSVSDAAPVESFAWPPSTRLTYTLTGQYRGPVEGQAQVEWLLEGARYQVHMDLSIGPSFAPLASRRVSSEGIITAQGLSPRRYDEDTRALLRQPQRLTVLLEEDRVRLANGREVARPAQVQDSASQFVHLTWLFTTQPERLRVGQQVSLPLALPRHLEAWVYEVMEAQTLDTPVGAVETFHVKPRRPPRPGQDLVAEIWVAPSLHYLPVRILIRQDEATYLDLLITRLPQQAQHQR